MSDLEKAVDIFMKIKCEHNYELIEGQAIYNRNHVAKGMSISSKYWHCYKCNRNKDYEPKPSKRGEDE